MGKARTAEQRKKRRAAPYNSYVAEKRLSKYHETAKTVNKFRRQRKHLEQEASSGAIDYVDDYEAKLLDPFASKPRIVEPEVSVPSRSRGKKRARNGKAQQKEAQPEEEEFEETDTEQVAAEEEEEEDQMVFKSARTAESDEEADLIAKWRATRRKAQNDDSEETKLSEKKEANLSSEAAAPVKAKKMKKSKGMYAAEMDAWKAEQAKKEAERIDRLTDMELREQRRKKSMRDRSIRGKEMNARTRKGQPLLGNQMQKILSKLQSR